MKLYSAKIEMKDAKSNRRFRNILANSGEILESGEIRDLTNLYVMGRDGKLIKISDLATDPEKQTEEYSVKAQADHGELVDGEFVPSVEKVFGACRVWLGADGLRARMYFADNDSLADHAWAISEDASYSTGIDWYPDGYYGADNEIDESIGILREISMVLTGNDPRAKTIDSNSAKAQRSVDGENKINYRKENTMGKTKDALTPDERRAMTERLNRAVDEVIDEFTTDVPENETQPTARDTKDEASATEAEAPAAEEKKDALRMPVVVVRDRMAKQEIATADSARTPWHNSAAGHKAFADTLRKAGRFGASFDMMWRAECEKHKSLDDISGLPTPAPLQQIIVDEIENSDGIISHFELIATKSLRVTAIAADAGEAGRAHGHKKGDTKVNQELTATNRDVLVKMVYKRLNLDATELYENPFLVDFRVRELIRSIVREVEMAAIIGDGRVAPTGSDPDLRMFDGTRGFWSIKADAADGANNFASTITLAEGDNLYDAVIKARANIKTEGRLVVVTKGSAVGGLRLAKTSAGYLVTPGANIEQLLDVERVYTPSWMDADENLAYIFVTKSYKMIGESNIRQRAEFDTSINSDILLAEVPRGGSLGAHMSAVAIAPYAAA